MTLPEQHDVPQLTVVSMPVSEGAQAVCCADAISMATETEHAGLLNAGSTAHSTQSGRICNDESE